MDQWSVISQNPDVLSVNERDFAHKIYLPILKDVWKRIEKATRFRWKATSYLRDSPSHRLGIALDIAPDVHPGSFDHHALSKGSDPVLYKRAPLLRILQKVTSNLPDYPYTVGIFVEPGHIHLGLFTKNKPRDHRLIKWGIVRDVFHDAPQRSQLPIIEDYEDTAV